MRGPFDYQKMQEFRMRLFTAFLAFSLIFTSFPASTLAQTSTPDTLPSVPTPQGVFVSPPSAPPPSYQELMREFRAIQLGKEYNGTAISESDRHTRRQGLVSSLESYLIQEKQTLSDLGVPSDKQKAHVKSIQSQIRALGGTPTFLDKIKKFFLSVFGFWDEGINSMDIIVQQKDPDEFLIPEKPASFGVMPEPESVQETNRVIVTDEELEKANLNEKSLPQELKDLLVTEKAEAGAEDLPTLDDLKDDGGEITLSYAIRALAKDLDYNPSKIFHFVRNTIDYEPYYGAKKGATGCLLEKLCNDTDTASLLIALYRASGIPARYSKSLIIVSIDQLKDLLAVADPKATYAALAKGRVPIFTLSDVGSTTLKDADFSKVSKLALEWTYAEIFYEYDYRGANVSNFLDLSAIESTPDLQTLLASYPQKFWIPVDGALKAYTHTKKETLADTAQFDADSFLTEYLTSSDTSSPLEAYFSFLKNKTGKDPKEYLSTKELQKIEYSILPPNVPFLRVKQAEGTLFQNGKSQNITIDQEHWPVLPDSRKATVTISILKNEDKSTILQKKFWGSEINNADITLSYEGLTDQDKKTIEKLGGIHQTPTDLADIVPTLSLATQTISTDKKVGIGDTLILRFTYGQDGNTIFEDEKFSVAGNSEGIAIALSRPFADPLLDTPAKVLLAGNAAIAKEYLSRVYKDTVVLAGNFDQSASIEFSRAVVTQNRILTLVNGSPTTFDFKGLSIDAGMYSRSVSATDSFFTHGREFPLLLGVTGSFHESEVLTRLTGLEAISTVTGLKYAYANQGDFPVKVITNQNKSEIDTLALSDNTKKNFKEDIQNGNTIITPVKPITKGTWTGILYLSHGFKDGVYSGRYAIGEQSQSNGGFTTDTVQLASWQNDSSKTQYAYQLDRGPDRFIYKDNPAKNIMCLLPIELYQAIEQGKVASGWSLKKYGKPCMNEGPNTFSDVSPHYFVVATDGAYFLDSTDSYAYWMTNDEILSPFISSLQARGLDSNISMRKIFPYWGTYVNEIRDGKELLSLDVFNPKLKQVFPIEAEMADKYISSDLIQNRYVPYRLKYPTSSMSEETAVSPKGTVGEVQQFSKGRMYLFFDGRREFSTKTFIVYGPWKAKFDDLGGISAVGYPSSDVAHVFTPNNTLEQQFETYNCQERYDDSIDCKERTTFSDMKHGLEKYYDSTALSIIPFVLVKNDAIIRSYKKFLEGIDSAQNTGTERYAYCLLLKAKDLNSYSLPKSFLANLSCLPQLVWGDIQDIRSKKDEAQTQLAFFESQNEQEYSVLALLRDEIEKHVENADVSRDEWLGYVSVDLGTFLIPVGSISKGGEQIFKKIALDATENYAKELAAKQISKQAFLKEIKNAIVEGAKKQEGSNLTQYQLEEIAERSVVKAMQRAGSNAFTRGGNPIQYNVTKKNTTIKDMIGGKEVVTILKENFFTETGSNIHILDNGKLLKARIVNRGDITDKRFHVSNLIVDQYEFVAGDISNVDVLVMDKIIEVQTLKTIEKKGKDAFLNDTIIGRLSQRVIEQTGKQIDRVNVENFVFDSEVLGGKYFNATIYLK
ncbi:hypothetical protein HY621_01130 [Candidatus Uhrbacteria bacterium]|nr:hypothetical protein [Candidatus Uhrbacteria bacterium]